MWNKDLEWRNDFSITIPVIEDSFPFEMKEKVEDGLEKFGFKLTNNNLKLSVEEKVCHMPGVYRGRVVFEEKEFLSFAMWVVIDDDKEC
jgi:hypothetical protein